MPEENTIWMRLVQSGLWTELMVFFPLAALGAGAGFLLGFREWAPLAVMAFGIPCVFWVVVHRLALEDAEEISQRKRDMML